MQTIILNLSQKIKIKIKGSARYRRDLKNLKRQSNDSVYRQDFPILANAPVLSDFYESAGSLSGHYFHQDLMIAQEIYKASPKRHVDVGSRTDGFVAHIATFRTIEVLDTRPLVSKISNIIFKQLDITSAFNYEDEENQTDSLSCLHTLEHFGLGRYSDPVNFDGWLIGLQNLHKMLKQGGTLYLSVPTSNKQRIEFNSHRIFSIPFLMKVLEPLFSISEVAFVDDHGDLHRNIDCNSKKVLNSFDSNYGLSIWILIKR
jgi:hypothetical protein